MSRRLLMIGWTVAALSLGSLTGCDSGPETGTTPDTHDADAKAGHMVHPAGGPNSPDAKKAAP